MVISYQILEPMLYKYFCSSVCEKFEATRAKVAPVN